MPEVTETPRMTETASAGKTQPPENLVICENYHYVRKPVYDFFKRAMDIVCSLAALIVLLPLLLVTAVLIKLEDGGPVFFTQTRVTRDGQKFPMIKFRSMCVDAEKKLAALQAHNEMDGPVFKMVDDPRITRVGKWIRRLSIDELPQLLNVLSGEMSVIGPRPPLPKEVAEYSERARHRLDVKGGLSCYWQCSGRNNISFAQWVEMDLQYIMDRSIWTDIKIIFRTIVAVLKMDGAE